MANRNKTPIIAASTCRDIHRLIVGRFDRTLSADEENRVDLHISTCPDCLVFHEQLVLIRKACEALRRGRMPSDAIESREGRRKP